MRTRKQLLPAGGEVIRNDETSAWNPLYPPEYGGERGEP